MSVEIVTHCYAYDLPQYSYFLEAHLWSLETFAPQGTKVSICCWLDDELTCETAAGHQHQSKIDITMLFLSRKDLFNRAIGRNFAALRTERDIVWFTDVDHVFGEGCIQALEQQMKMSNAILHYPSSIKIHKTHALGDECWNQLRELGRFRLNEDDFEEKVYNKAIGGVQIVPGDFARKYGYLNENKRSLRQTDGKQPFPSFRDDVQFRRYCEAKGETRKIELPNLYRLRHSKTSYQ